MAGGFSFGGIFFAPLATIWIACPEKKGAVSMNETNRRQERPARKLPVAKNEEVEFDAEFADEDDAEALQRAHDADARQEHE
jgi:hypothetical protein